jgi:fermentation-respiration switch protein FrsA (DUF1100 family)
MTWAGWTIVATLCIGLMMWGAGRLIYYPMRYPGGDWSIQQVLGAEDVSLVASDGTRLHAWWIAVPGSSIATVHLHGNAGNITHRGLSARSIVSAGSGLLLLDYRGYGKSEGRPSEPGLYLDADAAYDHLRRKGYKPEQIVIHGESLGGAAAMDLASRKPAAALVLEAPFTSVKAVASRVLPLIGPLFVRGFDNLERVKRIHSPLLIVHGDRDEVIPYELGKKLFEAANGPKWLWTVNGAGHNDLHVVARDEFPSRLSEFYRASGIEQDRAR